MGIPIIFWLVCLHREAILASGILKSLRSWGGTQRAFEKKPQLQKMVPNQMQMLFRLGFHFFSLARE